MTERQPILTGEPASRSLSSPLDRMKGSTTDYPRESTIVTLFESAVEKYPERIAVSFCGSDLSYRDLNRRANQLAHRLVRMGVRSETFVGICAERSVEMIVGILAILKAGAAYVPFDATYPAERIDFMIEDTKSPIILTQKKLAPAVIGNRTVETICLDEDLPRLGASEEQNPLNSATATGLAY